jgi:hypothetical protein
MDYGVKEIQKMSDEHLINSAYYHWRIAVDKWVDKQVEGKFHKSLKQYIEKNYPKYFDILREIKERKLSFNAPHQRGMLIANWEENEPLKKRPAHNEQK